MTPIISALSEVSDRYDAVFCDLWGCLHDGVRALPEAVEALQGFKARGGTVVLLTNAPRPRVYVERQIERLGVPRDCWDTIATSGDSARTGMFQGDVGQKVWFVGEETDQVFFDPLKLVHDPVAVERVDLSEAEGIVCCGPRDPLSPPDVMREELEDAKARGLKLLCANPDVIVDRGDTREWCAGAVAAYYEELGGTALYYGKPHAPVYDLARQRMAEAGREPEGARVLAIGDGIATDIAGAEGQGIDSLFITGGLAAAETKTTDQPDADALGRYLAEAPHTPTYALGKLR